MAEDPLDHLISATLAIDGDEARALRPALPFAGAAGAPPPEPVNTFHLDSGTVSEVGAWPSEETAPATARQAARTAPIAPSSAPTSAAAPGARAAQPALVAPALVQPIAPAVVAPPSAWVPAQPAPPAARPQPAPPLAAPPIGGAPSAMGAILASATGVPIGTAIAPPPRVSEDALGGAPSAFAASNAARSDEVRAPRAAEPRTTPSTNNDRAPSLERVDYLWHEEATEAAVLRSPHLGKATAKDDIEDEWQTANPAPAVTRERGEIRGVLARAPARSIEDVQTLYEESLDDGVDRVYCVVSGELTLSFEPVQMLKTTLGVITPFLSSDVNLKHAYDAAHEALKTPGGLAPSIAQSHKDRVDEALKGALRGSSAPLEAVMDRALIEDRAWSRRRVFGASLVRAALVPRDASRARDASHGVPCYLPDAAAEQLPLMRTCAVRMIVEVRPSQDAVESHPLALRVVALAREVGLTRRR